MLYRNSVIQPQPDMPRPSSCNESLDPNCTYFARQTIARKCDPVTLYLLNQIFFYYCIVIVVVGIVGNGVGVALLLYARCKLRRYSLNLFLIAVYFCDFSFLLSMALQLARVGKLNVRLFPIFCQFSVYTTNVFNLTSQWCMWVLSAERYLAICRPMFIYHVNGTRNTVKLLIGIVVFALLFECWVFFVITNDAYNRCISRFGHVVFDVLNLSEATVSSVVPGCMIVAFTVGTFRGLRRHRSLFTEVDPSVLRGRATTTTDAVGNVKTAATTAGGGDTFAVVSKRASQRLHRRERQTAWFLMAIVLVDTVLNLQNYVVRVFSATGKVPVSMCIEFRILHIISFMLYYLQYALNVFYLIACPRNGYFVKRKRSCLVSSSESFRKRSFDVMQTLKTMNTIANNNL